MRSVPLGVNGWPARVELRVQEVRVERGVVDCDDGAVRVGGEGGRYVGERRGTGHVGLRDAVDLGDPVASSGGEAGGFDVHDRVGRRGGDEGRRDVRGSGDDVRVPNDVVEACEAANA